MVMCASALEHMKTLGITQCTYLGNDDVRQRLGAHEELVGALVLQGLLVVLQVVLDAVVDVGDLADLKLPALQLEVLLQLRPAPDQQLPRLPVVQRQVCGVHSQRVNTGQVCEVCSQRVNTVTGDL